jgi:hypothetical protein
MGRLTRNTNRRDKIMNKQKFKKMVLLAVDKIMIQNKQSVIFRTSGSINSSCVYRGEGGACCPVGFMMDDETAKKADLQPDNGIKNIVALGIWGEHLNGEQIHHLSLLQKAHAAATGIGQFKSKFVKCIYLETKLNWVYEHLRSKAVEYAPD